MNDDATLIPGPWPDRLPEQVDDSDELDVSPRASEVISIPRATLEELTQELVHQREENTRLRAALALGPSVSQATGVLMFRYGLDEERALDLMTRWSDQVDMGLGDFASSVLDVVARNPESLEAVLLAATLRGGRRAGGKPAITWGDA